MGLGCSELIQVIGDSLMLGLMGRGLMPKPSRCRFPWNQLLAALPKLKVLLWFGTSGKLSNPRPGTVALYFELVPVIF